MGDPVFQNKVSEMKINMKMISSPGFPDVRTSCMENVLHPLRSRTPHVPRKYPPLHPATAMDIATEALPGPNMPATTVGRVVKKEPFAAPLRVAKTASGPIVLETGQIANIPDPEVSLCQDSGERTC